MATATPFAILQESKHPHENFTAAHVLEFRLKKTVRGEVRFDDASRALYSTDSSNYRQIPIGLVIPRDSADVIATIAACREFGAAVLTRGGGTSVAGQTCNVAVVIDFSKYMRSVIELDPATHRARVEPGIVLELPCVHQKPKKHELTLRARIPQRTAAAPLAE